MEQRTTGGGGITPWNWFNSTPQLHCTLFTSEDTHTYTNNKNTVHRFALAHSLPPMLVKLPKQSFGIWSIYGYGMKSRVCPPLCLQAWSYSVWTRGQIISNELCKSLQSNASWQWVMLKTPSQRDYMNIFIGQQKAKESRRRTFSISMKACSFVLMTRRAGFWVLISSSVLVGSSGRYCWIMCWRNWSLAGQLIHLCWIMTMLLVMSLFSSTVAPFGQWYRVVFTNKKLND